jgi:hypothetical protein
MIENYGCRETRLEVTEKTLVIIEKLVGNINEVKNCNDHTTLVTKHKLTGCHVFEGKVLVKEPQFINTP